MDLNDLRNRLLQGGEYTPEELREAITQLRTVRVEAATKSAKKREEKAGISNEELDNQLKGFGLDI